MGFQDRSVWTGSGADGKQLKEGGWGGGVEALRNIQIFGICINPTVVITVKAEFRAGKHKCMHASGRSGLLQMLM